MWVCNNSYWTQSPGLLDKMHSNNLCSSGSDTLWNQQEQPPIPSLDPDSALWESKTGVNPACYNLACEDLKESHPGLKNSFQATCKKKKDNQPIAFIWQLPLNSTRLSRNCHPVRGIALWSPFIFLYNCLCIYTKMAQSVTETKPTSSWIFIYHFSAKMNVKPTASPKWHVAHFLTHLKLEASARTQLSP